jgi:EAL domain-containing protein (putative c-di-GMP-specific phosphodiesterase class I)
MNKNLLKLAITVPSIVGTLVVASVLIFNVVRNFIIEDNEVLVHSVAQSMLPALLVNDTQQVDAMLKALESYPGIESAELLSAEGASIANYAKAGQPFEPMLQSFELASASENPNRVHVMAPIAFDSLIVANLHIAVNLWPSYLRIITWLGVLLILPSVIYVLIKQFRIKIRFDKVDRTRDGGSDQGGGSLDVSQALNAEMRDADISLEYQSIQRMGDGGLFGMSVIVCWRHPSGQTVQVSPSTFVGLAEKSGLCLPFDEWLLTAACKQAAAWQYLYGPLILSLNITAAQFRDPTFAQKIRRICAQTQYPHQLLELVAHESVVSAHPQQARDYVDAFAAQGLSVMIDGFGLAKSSLDLLTVLPINKVKLDPKMVKRMSHDAQIDQLIQATIAQALLNDVQVMADGLETIEQRLALQRMGCILGQGAYFQKPLTASQFESFLKTRPFDASLDLMVNMNKKSITKDASGFSVA